jgi:hypothetical protein
VEAAASVVAVVVAVLPVAAVVAVVVVEVCHDRLRSLILVASDAWVIAGCVRHGPCSVVAILASTSECEFTALSPQYSFDQDRC